MLDRVVNVKVFKTNTTSLPKYQHPQEDACADIFVDWIERKVDRIICHTGLYVEVPKGFRIDIYPRSSIVNTGWYIPNSPGIIDSGYRGEILVVFRHTVTLDREPFPFKEGMRCAQMALVPVYNINWITVNKEDLNPSERGDGGYGSTGK